ncbi:MAG: HAMP domain-containing sensor histidine kinase [Microvirga sp.]
MRVRWRKPRIRTALLAINVSLLLLPLIGVWVLRLYESALVRQTEAELIAQAATIGAAYKAEWLRAVTARPKDGGGILDHLPMASVTESQAESYWRPRFAVLDLATDPVLPVPPPADPNAEPADPAAIAAGERLQPVLADVQRITLAGLRVLDARGIVVATSGGDHGMTLRNQFEVSEALGGRPVSSLRARVRQGTDPVDPGSISRGSRVRVFLALPVIEQGRVLGAVLLSRTPVSIEQALYGKRWHLAGLALALLTAGAGMALFTGYTVSRPIRAVTEQAKAAAAGERVVMPRTRRSATREADELWSSITSMARTLEQRADFIRAFAAEVSHEFKTPLAAIRGAVEISRDHADTMTRQERDHFLANIGADVERLDRLVRRLLELARAEAPGPVMVEDVDLGQAVREAAAPFQAAGLSVDVDAPPGTVIVRTAHEALHAALSNLLDNIRQHAGDGAQARISWRVDKTARHVALRVSDNGRGISAGNADRVFDRFFTTARNTGGTGLGLSIVQSRLEACGVSIRLVAAQAGAAFLITLPLAG